MDEVKPKLTKKKKFENELNESESRFRLMADASPVMIWMTNKYNQLEYMNRTKLDFLGKNLEDLKDNGWIDTRHPEDRNKFINTLSEAIKKREKFSIEVRVKNNKGEYRWLLDAAAPRFLDDGTFVGFIGSGMDITERQNSRINLEKSLKEKEILLKEIHHRVKNNLQIISSLLNLQRNYITDPAVLNIFKSSQNRISAMALLHEKLYGSENLSDIDFHEYVKSLTRSLLDTYKNIVSDIRINVNIEKFQLDIDTSISLGLIINELVSNSLKYAFKGKEKGMISISMNYIEDKNELNLQVSDDGIGLPDDFKIQKNKSLGLELVSSIVEQLNGNLIISNNGKTEFKITINPNVKELIPS